MDAGKSTMLDSVGASNPLGGGSQQKAGSPESFNSSGKKLGSSSDENLTNKGNSSVHKLNGELGTPEKNNKKNCLSKPTNRARSRSKSPRGKSPVKKELVSKSPNNKEQAESSPGKKSKKDAQTKNKARVKSPDKKSPVKNKKEQKSPNKQSPIAKKNSPKESNAVNNENVESSKAAPKKQAKKRKVKDDANPVDKAGDQKLEPKPKKSKNQSDDGNPNKPKRKYTKKSKKIEPGCSDENTKNAADPEGKPLKTEATDNVNHTSDENTHEVTPDNKSGIVQNGILSESEAKLLSAPCAPLVANSKKVTTKKGTNKKPLKSEVSLPPLHHTVLKPTLPSDTLANNHGSGEPDDSDTMDYSVNNTSSNITDNLVEKKVVKIDDIEITELSDLNSSRESGDENDLEQCVIEKPQALNESMSSPQSETTSSGVGLTKGAETDGDKLFVCDQAGCKYRGKSKVLLRKHLTHHGIYHCAHCEFLGHLYQDLETHMVANHPQRWGRKKCKKCTRYIRGDEFETHDQTCEGKKMFHCEICGKEFKYESLFREHEKKMHGAHNCQFCDFIGDSKQILSHHMSQVHPKKKPDKHRCKQCESLFPSKKLLAEHVKTVHGTVVKTANESNDGGQLIGTDADLLSPETVTRHPEMGSEHMTLPPQAGGNTLQNCTEFSQETNNEMMDTIDSVKQEPSNLLTCNKGTVSANSSYNNAAERIPYENLPPQGSPPSILLEVPGITAHIKTVDSDKFNTSLEGVEIKLESADTSQTPVKSNVHPPIQNPVPILPKNIMEERPFACEKCPKRFKEQKTLNGHQNVHNKELNFKCDVEECRLAFKTARLLNFHKKTVHEVAPGVPMHPCEHPDCHLVFKKKGQLKKHEVVHTGERRYLCEWPNCGKAFRHNANLKIHNLLHTGEKPIKCNYCDFSCRQKSSLIHHMKTKHKEIGWPLPKKDMPDLPTHDYPPTPLNDENEDRYSESFDDSKSDLDNSIDRISEADISGNSEPPKLEPDVEPPIYPKMLSTPTKAMVKAMAPGFRMNTPGFEKMKPISPISASVPSSINKSSHTDVYDFNDDDNDSGIPVSLPKKHDKGQVKSPSRPLGNASSLELLKAMEPMNLSSDHKPIPEEVKVIKKKRSPKKKKEESIADSSKSDAADTSMNTSMDTSIDTSMDTSIDQSFDTSKEEGHDKTKEFVSAPVEVSSGPYQDSDSGVRSQESQDRASSLDMVEEHVSENVPLSATSSESAGPSNEELNNDEAEMEPQEPVAVPSQPEPYPDPPAHMMHSSEESPSPISDSELHHAQQQESHNNEGEVYHEQDHLAIDDSGVSDMPPDVEELALHRPVAPGEPGLLDMHLTGKRDNSGHSFDLPHDIDPDEAAKLLEGPNTFDEDPKITSGSHEVPVIMSNTQSGKDDYLPPSPSSHNNSSSIHHEQDQGDINTGQFDYNSYGQHHPGDFDEIHDLSSHDKERVESYTDPAQRRPSSSYVPDFLPTMATTSTGSSGMGPPSVSSSYSSPSYSVPPAHSQSDLPAYGAPGSNLPQYPPHSTSVPYLSPSSTHNTYPTSTSAGSGISSYPAITTTSFTESQSSERVPSVTDTRPGSFRDLEATTVTSSSYPGSTYQTSRDLFGYFQDPNLPLSHIAAQQDPRSLTYPSQQSSLQALQRSSADFLQRASATGLTGMNYPSVTESLARLSQTTTQQPWIGHDERSRPWAQASPIIMPPELDGASPLNRNPFSSARPEYSSLDSAAKRPDSAFPSIPPQSVPSASDRYDVASAYMGGAGHFNPSSNYSKTLPPSVSAPTKQLEEAYRHSAATHMSDYRLSQAAPSVTDMYSRMGMNPALGLDKYYAYPRDAMYRTQHIGATPNPFMPQTSTAQMPYADRDYAARNPYAQDSAYSKYLQPANLTQPLPGLQAAPADYFQARPGAPDPYDPYRRSVIHNMMTRYF